MTEIIQKHIMQTLRDLSGPKRKAKLAAIAARLEPLTAGQVGMMVDTNLLEAAHAMMERHNQKAYNAYKDKYRNTPHNQRPAFKAPFWWSPGKEQEQQGKWTAQLVEAFLAHTR